LFALSNSDRDLIDASIRAIGVPFDGAIVASEIGSYKPGHGHWRTFYETTGADQDRHVHVAQSHFHDIVPTWRRAVLGSPRHRPGTERYVQPASHLH
jgi:2-haloacid dehalogenase